MRLSYAEIEHTVGIVHDLLDEPTIELPWQEEVISDSEHVSVRWALRDGERPAASGRGRHPNRRPGRRAGGAHPDRARWDRADPLGCRRNEPTMAELVGKVIDDTDRTPTPRRW